MIQKIIVTLSLFVLIGLILQQEQKVNAFCIGDCSLSQPPVVDNHNFREKCIKVLDVLGVNSPAEINQCVKTAVAMYDALTK